MRLILRLLNKKIKKKYQQLETENKNRIENLEGIIKEKEVKIASLEEDITRTDQLIQTLETRVNRNENAHLNDIKMLANNILEKGEKINSLDIQREKAVEINNAQNEKIDKIINEQKNLINLVYKPKYMQIKNKWKYFDNIRKCCEDNCVNTNTPIGKCKNGNGFIEIINNTDIKYNKCIEEGENKKVWLNAENKFYKPKNDFTTLSYYYEIKIKKEGMNDYSSFGFRNTKIYIVLGNNGFINYSPAPNTKPISFKIPSFSWNDGDIFGFGLVFPPTKILEKHPYVFFTQNGNEIGKAISLSEESYDYYELYANLNCLSIETNFGNDLDANPFCFDVSKHLFAEEFYN
uniref:Uncharacterized protein n=1 Tax=Meloidogyne enterolobii TaxID=390850 RepID=A0A6V7UQ29_MELEN|nr:unnamed protein product [Meloidogyne enterolobii]